MYTFIHTKTYIYTQLHTHLYVTKSSNCLYVATCLQAPITAIRLCSSRTVHDMSFWVASTSTSAAFVETLM